MRLCTPTLLIACLFLPRLSPAADPPTVEFERFRLTEEYFAEGASFGDFNHDGAPDIVCGPNWFAGPEFTESHQFYDGAAFPNDRGYSDNFFSFVFDFSGDGWDDVLVVGLPGTPAYWYENPKGEGDWVKRLAFSVVDNEAPVFDDLTGDGQPEIICTFEGRLGFARPVDGAPDQEWEWNSISEPGPWQRFSHGLGIGDINGDGLTDFLTPEGWWEQPAEGVTEELWTHHPYRFCGGGAQIHAYDIDGDGDNDVVTSLAAHAWGLNWFEHVQSDDGSITFEPHVLMGERVEDSAYGVRFSQLHCVECVDVDGDGLRDIVTGKCYWAHNGHDPGAAEPAVLYWFRLVRENGEARFVPELIDDDSGTGRQIRVADVDRDGRVDIVAGNKKGTFVFRQL